MLILSANYTYTYLLGDDWEHEEIFTDDDEAVGNDPEEREDLAPEVPAPPEIKQVSFQFLLGSMMSKPVLVRKFKCDFCNSVDLDLSIDYYF